MRLEVNHAYEPTLAYMLLKDNLSICSNHTNFVLLSRINYLFFIFIGRGHMRVWQNLVRLGRLGELGWLGRLGRVSSSVCLILKYFYGNGRNASTFQASALLKSTSTPLATQTSPKLRSKELYPTWHKATARVWIYNTTRGGETLGPINPPTTVGDYFLTRLVFILSKWFLGTWRWFYNTLLNWPA